jgi:hypothetical protein
VSLAAGINEQQNMATKQNPASQQLAVNIPVTQTGVQLQSFDDMARFCRAVVNSGLAPKTFNTPEAVMVAIQHGMELGLAPMQALQSIAVVNGRPTIWGDAALALCTAHPSFLDIEETIEGNTATCIIKRRDRSAVVRTFGEADAKRAGLWGKAGPWQQYPQRMLQMRARSWAVRDAFPDALKGIGIREEVQDYSTPKQVSGRVVATDLVLPEEPAPVELAPVEPVTATVATQQEELL